MYQIIHTKSGRKRGITTIAGVKEALRNAHARKFEIKVYEVETGDLIGEVRCVNAEKKQWLAVLGNESIRESRTLQLAWLEQLSELKRYEPEVKPPGAPDGEKYLSVIVLNRPATDIRAILNRKHPGVYEVEHLEAGKCSVFLTDSKKS
jgi:hypothetical protein